jgi:hypothetical protein
MNTKRLSPAATVAAIAAVIMWAAFAALLWHSAGTKDVDLWTHETWVFSSIQAIAFAAAGALFGTAVQQDRVHKAETRADQAQDDAANGRALARVLQSDAAPTNIAAGRPVAPPERGDATSGDDVRQQHAALARSLFGDLLDDTTGS